MSINRNRFKIELTDWDDNTNSYTKHFDNEEAFQRLVETAEEILEDED